MCHQQNEVFAPLGGAPKSVDPNLEIHLASPPKRQAQRVAERDTLARSKPGMWRMRLGDGTRHEQTLKL